MEFLICRDQRTGGEYTDAAAKEDDARYGYYANEVADIEVAIDLDASDLYEGSGEPDDPSSADVSGGARVLNDVRYYTPIGQHPAFNRLVFRADQIIQLTDKELEQAEEQALEEARENAEPEYSPC